MVVGKSVPTALQHGGIPWWWAVCGRGCLGCGWGLSFRGFSFSVAVAAGLSMDVPPSSPSSSGLKNQGNEGNGVNRPDIPGRDWTIIIIAIKLTSFPLLKLFGDGPTPADIMTDSLAYLRIYFMGSSFFPEHSERYL